LRGIPSSWFRNLGLQGKLALNSWISSFKVKHSANRGPLIILRQLLFLTWAIKGFFRSLSWALNSFASSLGPKIRVFGPYFWAVGTNLGSGPIRFPKNLPSSFDVFPYWRRFVSPRGFGKLGGFRGSPSPLQLFWVTELRFRGGFVGGPIQIGLGKVFSTCWLGRDQYQLFWESFFLESLGALL